MTGDRLRSSASALVAVTVAAFVLAALSLVVGVPWSASAHRKPVDLDRLTAATTAATLRHAPRDTHPGATTRGEVAHPLRVLPVFAKPGKRPFAKVGPREIGETWLPVVARRGPWSQVLLPSRPNGSTGWIRTAQVERRTTPYVVRVHLGSRTLELFSDGTLLGRWPVAVGKPSTPTPAGRTFVLGSITDRHQAYSPVILPLGAHSDTLDSYGGGPGTVALHTWPDASVFGTAASHGCVRVPPDALSELTDVPLGTLVLIDHS